MRILPILLLLLFPSSALATNYCTNDAKACYLFTETTGTSVADSTGNGNTGTFNSSGHPAWDTTVPSFAKSGQAAGSVNYSTSGSAESITLGTSNNLAPYNSAFTFCAWINPTSTTINGGDPRYFLRGSVFLAGSDPKGIYLQIDGATALVRQSLNNSFSFNVFQLFCVTGDGSTTAANYHLYINGVEPTYFLTQNGSSLTSNAGATMYLGNNAAGTRSSSSRISESAFWTRQLTSGEITNVYNYGLTEGSGRFLSIL